MRVLNVKESKAEFRKTFKGCNGTFAITIEPAKERIRIATYDHKSNNVIDLFIQIEVDSWETKKVTLNSVDRLDVVWDFIWNKDGFWLELYKDAYRDLETRAKSHDTVYTVAEIIFNTKRKRYIYKTFECNSIQYIL